MKSFGHLLDQAKHGHMGGGSRGIGIARLDHHRRAVSAEGDPHEEAPQVSLDCHSCLVSKSLSNSKLLGTSASLLVTSALLVVTRSY